MNDRQATSSRPLRNVGAQRCAPRRAREVGDRSGEAQGRSGNDHLCQEASPEHGLAEDVGACAARCDAFDCLLDDEQATLKCEEVAETDTAHTVSDLGDTVRKQSKDRDRHNDCGENGEVAVDVEMRCAVAVDVGCG